MKNFVPLFLFLIATAACASTATSVRQVHSVANPTYTYQYVELFHSLTQATVNGSIFDSSGQTLAIATGAAGSEVVQFIVPPGGVDFNGAFSTGTRISVIALSDTAETGELDVSLFY